uniref:Uncharacterized protein n=1 Tax=Nelumbo nucifera TaxID=4432 RepID=A0A822YI24_NELNU|nr:TPA_asm: hypothetical protein HUJ06_010624 [Nelumbo nucifera]
MEEFSAINSVQMIQRFKKGSPVHEAPANAGFAKKRNGRIFCNKKCLKKLLENCFHG